MVIRVCIARFPNIIELSQEGEVTGILSGLAREVLSLAKSLGNVSLMASDRLGDYDSRTAKYDGCLGSVQRNESDTHIPFIDFPILAPGIVQEYVVFDSTVVMVSVYEKDAGNRSTLDVMDAFYSIGYDVWALTILMMLTFFSLIMTIYSLNIMAVVMREHKQIPAKSLVSNERFRRALRLTSCLVIGTLMKQGSSFTYKNKRFAARLSLLLSIIFIFFLMFFFSAMINTEMVVQIRPDTISSYSDILADKKLKPVWAKQFNEHMYFRDADPASPEGRIWARAEKFGVENCLVSGSIGNLMPGIQAIGSRKSVLLGPGYVAQALITNLCRLSRASDVMKNFNGWLKSDPAAPEKMTGLARSSALPAEIARKMHHLIQVMFEMKLTYTTMKQIENLAPADGTDLQSVSECASSVIVYPDHILVIPTTSYYFKLFRMTSCVIVVSLVLLTLEHSKKLIDRLSWKKKSPVQGKLPEKHIHVPVRGAAHSFVCRTR